jgi:hypothetical protein
MKKAYEKHLPEILGAGKGQRGDGRGDGRGRVQVRFTTCTHPNWKISPSPQILSTFSGGIVVI